MSTMRKKGRGVQVASAFGNLYIIKLNQALRAIRLFLMA